MLSANDHSDSDFDVSHTLCTNALARSTAAPAATLVGGWELEHTAFFSVLGFSPSRANFFQFFAPILHLSQLQLQ